MYHNTYCSPMRRCLFSYSWLAFKGLRRQKQHPGIAILIRSSSFVTAVGKKPRQISSRLPALSHPPPRRRLSSHHLQRGSALSPCQSLPHTVQQPCAGPSKQSSWPSRPPPSLKSPSRTLTSSWASWAASRPSPARGQAPRACPPSRHLSDPAPPEPRREL